MNVDNCIKNFRFFSEYHSLISENEYRMDDATNFILRKPMGVSGPHHSMEFTAIPTDLKLAPALLMGNTVVAKPSG